MISSYMNQILQRNRTSRSLFVSLSIHPSIERFFKELFHIIMGAGESQIHGTGQQPGNSSRSSCCSLEFESCMVGGGKARQGFCVAVWWQNFFFELEENVLTEKSQSLLLRPSTDWMRPTHIMEGNLLFSKSTDLKGNHI